MDYFVPDFGKDHELSHTDASLKAAEDSVGHHWVWAKDKKAKVVVYNDQRPLDSDISTSLGNLKDQESSIGHWDLPKDDWFIQTQSDPICSSSGCYQYKHKKKDRGYDIDYPVPNLG